MYSEKDLEHFTEEFRLLLRRAAQHLRADPHATRGTQLNMALAYWMREQASR